MILIFTNKADEEFISFVEKAIFLAELSSTKKKIVLLDRPSTEAVPSYLKEIKEAEASIIDIDQMNLLEYAYELGSIANALQRVYPKSTIHDTAKIETRIILITRKSIRSHRLLKHFSNFYSSISLNKGITNDVIAGLAKWLKDTVETFKPRVFFSYRSSNAKYAREIIQLLINKGASVWFDEFDIQPGDSILKEINRGISWSTHMILLIDKSFFKSKFTQAEMEAALNKHLSNNPRYFRGSPIQRPLIPLYLIDPQSKLIPPLLQRIRGLDCRNKSTNEIVEILWNSITIVGPR